MADLLAPYRITLADEYVRRRARNPRYTRSAYARALGVERTYLSKLTAGKILLSLDVAERVCRALKLDSEARREFLLSAAEEQRCHALYLIDPALTDCDPADPALNARPAPRTAGR